MADYWQQLREINQQLTRNLEELRNSRDEAEGNLIRSALDPKAGFGPKELDRRRTELRAEFEAKKQALEEEAERKRNELLEERKEKQALYEAEQHVNQALEELLEKHPRDKSASRRGAQGEGGPVTDEAELASSLALDNKGLDRGLGLYEQYLTPRENLKRIKRTPDRYLTKEERRKKYGREKHSRRKWLDSL